MNVGHGPPNHLNTRRKALLLPRNTRVYAAAIAACALYCVTAMGASRAPDPTVLTDVARLSADWHVNPKVSVVEGPYIETTDSGAINVGTGFLEMIDGIPSKDMRRFILTFSLLHEVWHVKQLPLFPPAKRSDDFIPVLECQADLMATRALLTPLLRESITQTADKGKADWSYLYLLRKLPKDILSFAPANTEKTYHLTLLERVLSVNIGFWRAAAERLLEVSRQRADLVPAFERMNRLGNAVSPLSVAEWSLQQCKEVVRLGVGRDQSFTLLSTPIVEFDTKPPDDSEMHKTSGAEFTNNSDRPVRVSMKALTGLIPKGEQGHFEEYIFLDGFDGSVDIAPGEKGKIMGKLSVPLVNGYDIFEWSWPFNVETLVSAEAIGPRPTPKNCNDLAAKRPGVVGTETIAALIKLGGGARNGFEDFRGKETGFGVPGYKTYVATVEVPGSTTVEIEEQGGGVVATAEMYRGDSHDAAEQVLRTQASAMESFCGATEGLTSQSTSNNGEPMFSVARLTAFSTAFVALSKTVSKDGETTYYVYWFVSAAY